MMCHGASGDFARLTISTLPTYFDDRKQALIYDFYFTNPAVAVLRFAEKVDPEC